MRYKETYTVYPRTLKSGKRIYYYQTYDDNGNRTTPKSTGQTSKTTAKYYCDKLLKQGLLIPEPKIEPTLPVSNSITFRKYTENWFLYDVCPYIQGKINRGGTHSKSFALAQRKHLENYLWPFFGKMKLKDITAQKIETWRDMMKASGKSNIYINHFYSALRVILTEAYRLDYIEKNPVDKVKRLIIKSKEKGIFTDKEIKKIFKSVDVWEGENFYYQLNWLAYRTGLRMGEIQALRAENIKKEKIIVEHSYDRQFGLKCTKSGEKRNVPIDKEIYTNLLELRLKYGTGDGFIFSFDGGKNPINQTTIGKYFRKACQNIKIKEELRKERNLTFHSWRHMLNTRLIESGLTGEVIREIIGHSNSAMTKKYAHVDGSKVAGLKEAMRGVV